MVGHKILALRMKVRFFLAQPAVGNSAANLLLYAYTRK